MSKYLVLAKSHINNRLVEEGETVDLPGLKYDPARDTNLSPVVEPKRGRGRNADVDVEAQETETAGEEAEAAALA